MPSSHPALNITLTPPTNTITSDSFLTKPSNDLACSRSFNHTHTVSTRGWSLYVCHGTGQEVLKVLSKTPSAAMWSSWLGFVKLLNYTGFLDAWCIGEMSMTVTEHESTGKRLRRAALFPICPAESHTVTTHTSESAPCPVSAIHFLVCVKA